MSDELEARVVEAIRAGDPGAWGDMATVPTRPVFEAALERIAQGDVDTGLVRSGFLAAASRGAPALASVFDLDRVGVDYVALALAASRQPEAVPILVRLLGHDELGTIAVAGLSRQRAHAFDEVREALSARARAVRLDAARVFAAWRTDTAWSRAVLEAWASETAPDVLDVLEPLAADARGEVSERTIASIRRSMTAEESEEVASHLQQALYTGHGAFLPDTLSAEPDRALVAARDHLALLSEGTRGVLTTWWAVADLFDDIAVKWWIAAGLFVDPHVGGTVAEWDSHEQRLRAAGPEAVTFVSRRFAREQLPTARLDRVVAWLAAEVTDDDIDIVATRLLSSDRERREAARDALVAFGPPGTIGALDYLDAPRIEQRTAAVEVVIAAPCRPARRPLEQALERERSQAVSELLAEAWFEVEGLFVEPERVLEGVRDTELSAELARLPDRLTAGPLPELTCRGATVSRIATAWLAARLRAQGRRGYDAIAASCVATLDPPSRDALRQSLLAEGVAADAPWQAHTWIAHADLNRVLECRGWFESDSRSSDLALARVRALREAGELGVWMLAVWSETGSYAPHRRLAREHLGDETSPEAWLCERLPDFGLDAWGNRPWRLGSRTELTMHWGDGELTVLNEAGDALKSIPSGRSSDDPAMVERDLELFRGVRDAAAFVTRALRDALERWMYEGSELPANVVRDFARHPIARDVAPRVLWGLERRGAPPLPLRLEEEGAFADLDDERVDANDDLRVLHPADMTADARRDWMTMFGDYEIVQPFEQLDRLVFRPRDAELSAVRFRRFGSREIDASRIRWAIWGSAWEFSPNAGRWHNVVVRTWRRWGVTACVRFAPGFSARGDDDDPAQTLHGAWVARGVDLLEPDQAERIAVIDAPPLVFSEIVHLLATVANARDEDRFE